MPLAENAIRASTVTRSPVERIVRGNVYSVPDAVEARGPESVRRRSGLPRWWQSSFSPLPSFLDLPAVWPICGSESSDCRAEGGRGLWVVQCCEQLTQFEAFLRDVRM